MRTSELKNLLHNSRDDQVSIYSIYYNFQNVTVESVSDEMVKVFYSDKEKGCQTLYIQLDWITAVEKI